MEGLNGQGVKGDVELPRPPPQTPGHQDTWEGESQGVEQGTGEV